MTADTHLLLDSGGQYDCGTTDITRTMHFGQPSEHVRRCFTAVLRGHIALDRVILPEGTPGCAVDALARAPLWRLGLNYRHGTGHGVGAALNVHEGPQSISARYYITAGLRAGMVCSNEPGYYEDGGFGIRIENLFYFEKAGTPFNFGGDAYLTPKAITLVPFQRKMIVVEVGACSMLSVVGRGEATPRGCGEESTAHAERSDGKCPHVHASGGKRGQGFPGWLCQGTLVGPGEHDAELSYRAPPCACAGFDAGGGAVGGRLPCPSAGRGGAAAGGQGAGVAQAFHRAPRGRRPGLTTPKGFLEAGSHAACCAERFPRSSAFYPFTDAVQALHRVALSAAGR